jgi:hypothetical protein
MVETFMVHRALLEKHTFPKMQEPILFAPLLEASLKDLVQPVKAKGLEGWSRRRNSKYGCGQDSAHS